MTAFKRDGIDTADNRISPIVERQLPAFVREQHPMFVKLMERYYEFVEQNGGAVWATKSLLDLQDIDYTEDRFLDLFHKELASTVPVGLLVDKRKLYKNIIQYHRARGTEKSYQLLFRMLFNDKIDFYYPYTDIFKLSDGTWIVDKTIRVFQQFGDPFAFSGKKITGVTSGTVGVVERVLKYQVGTAAVYELFLNSKTIDGGTFQPEEKVETDDGAIIAKVYTCINGVTITNRGKGYSVGDPITVSGGSGSDCRLVVGSVGRFGEVKRVDIVSPGVNYQTVPTLTFATKDDTATAVAVKGGLITYPGFWLNEDGMLSTTKYLHDSYFYQQFSYVIKSNESINLYREIIKKALHPAGLILFGSVFSDSLVRAPAKYKAPTRGAGNSWSRVVNYQHPFDDALEHKQTRHGIHIHVNPPGEGSRQLGPTFESVDRFKFQALPHDPYFNVARKVPGVTLWTKSNQGVIRDMGNKVSYWKNLSLNSVNNGGFHGPSNPNRRPIITREDNLENYVKRSSTFSKGAWGQVGLTAVDGALPNFELANSASTLTLHNSNEEHKITQSSLACAASLAESGQVYTLAVDIEKITGNDARYVWIGDMGDAVVHAATFDLDDDASLVGSTNIADSNVEDIGNGWFRVTIEFQRSDTGDFELEIAINDTGHTSGGPESWSAAGTEQIGVHRAQIKNILADDEYISTFEGPEVRGFNGRPLIRHDGTDDYMETLESLTDLVKNTDASVYVAYFQRSIASDSSTIKENEAVIQDQGQKMGLFVRSSGTLNLWHDDGSGESINRPVEQYSFYVVKISHTGGQIVLQHNETLPSVSTASGNTSALNNKVRIGWSTGTFVPGGGGGGTGGGFFPEGMFGEGMFGTGMFPQDDDDEESGGTGEVAYGKVSVGEIIFCNQALGSSIEKQLLDYLKKEWLDINYRRETHWMSAPNENYWDQYGNLQIQHLADLKINDFKLHPRRRTQLSISPYVRSKEVIGEIDEILFDLNPQYLIRQSIDSTGNKINWIKENKGNTLRFEPNAGIITRRPIHVASVAGFNGHPGVRFVAADLYQIQSQSPISTIISASELLGRVIFRTSDVSQTGTIIADNLSPANFRLYIDSGELIFEIIDSVGAKSVSVTIEDDTTYLAAFKLEGGEISLSVNGGTADTLSAGNIDEMGTAINLGGRGTDYFDGDIARIILASEVFDTTLLDSILTTKYAIA